MSDNKWKKAARVQSKCSILIEGLSGSGKSGLALAFAHALSGNSWSDVYAVDTESKSLDLFEGLQLSTKDKVEPFNKIDVSPEDGYAPSDLMSIRDDAIKLGAKAFIIDSSSPSWAGVGGILDRVTVLAEQNSKVNNFNAWGKPEVRNEKNILCTPTFWRDPRVHCITTVRLKEKFVQDETGVHSVGEEQVMQADAKYEPDLVLSMIKPGSTDGDNPVVRVIKSRYSIFRKDSVMEVTPEVINALAAYLDEGADPAVLNEQIRVDLATSIADIIKGDDGKKLQYNMWRNANGIAQDKKLKDFTLEQLEGIYKSISKS